MTARVDTGFVASVRAALDGEVHAILAEDAGTWRQLQHRRLAERIKALVAAWRDSRYAGDDRLLGHALGLAEMLRELQGASGLFRGGDNVDSPPDSAFSVNDLADAALLLRFADGEAAAAGKLAALLDEILAAITPALTGGGVHTPNHRWEISAALARLHRLAPQAALAERVEQWLAEGVDIADGLYSERSANYAAHVSNPSLLTIADVFDRPDLIDAVEQNLDATLDLLLPDGSVETVLSRRQDQRWPFPLAPYLLPLRRIAQLRDRGDLAWAAGLALAQGITAPGDAATRMLLDPGIAGVLPAAVEPARPRRRVFEEAGLVIDHRTAATTVVFGGSDFARYGRIRSGLANSPTFLRMIAGAAVLDSVRLSRTFFGLGPFRSDHLTVTSAPAPAATPDPSYPAAAASDSTSLAAMAPGSVAGAAVASGPPRLVAGAPDPSHPAAVLSDSASSGAGAPDPSHPAAVVSGPLLPAGGAPGSLPAADTAVTLGETVGASYYQPLAAGDLDRDGRYRLGDDGRFSAAMDFGQRGRDDVTLTTTVRVEIGDGRVGLTVDVTGAAVDWALELAFRPGGTMRGARILDTPGGSRWVLDATRTDSPPVRYDVGGDSLSVTVLEASDGEGGALLPAESEPSYHPGEEYEFLGGTDAASGELLYLAGRAPARVRIDIRASTHG